MVADEVRLPIPGGDELPARIAVDAHPAHEERGFDLVFGERSKYPFIHLLPGESGSVHRNRIVERERNLTARCGRRSMRQRCLRSSHTRVAQELSAVHGARLYN